MAVLQKVVNMSEYIDGSIGVSYSPHASAKLLNDMWAVTEGFTYQIDDKRSIHIPQGYLTDGASVPRWLWALIPPWGNHGKAAVVHDYLCEYLQVRCDGERVKITRDECNKIFYQCLNKTDVGKIKAKAMYAAVVAHTHLASIIYYSYDPVKHDIEKYLVSEFKRTGIWK